MAPLVSHSAAKGVAARVTWPRALSAGWLIAAGLVLHLVLAMSAGLSPDEAHYALYGAHPDWSYFDHPPLVGWLQAPFVAAGGFDLFMRIVPMLSWLLATLLMIALCRRLSLAIDSSSESAARRDGWVALMMLLSPLLNLLGVALVPDTLLIVLVPGVMSAVWRLRRPEAAQRIARWLPLALLLGLCILSKYTGVFVVLGALVTLLRFHGVRLLRLPGTWLCAVVVVAFASPIVAWNMQHGWASIAYQLAHSSGGEAWTARSMLRAVALQAALYGLLLPIAAVRGLRGRGRQSRDGREDFTDLRAMVIAFAVPVLVVFAVLSGRGSSLPHWTACGWMAVMPLAVAGMATLGERTVVALVLWQGGLLVAIVGLVLTGGPGAETGAAAISPTGIRVPGTHPDPVTDVIGWEAAALHGAGIAEQRGARGLVVMNWSLASRLAWYARPLPVFVAPAHMDQFQLWFGSLQPGDSAVVVDWSSMPLEVPLGPDGFSSCGSVGQLPTVVDGRQLAHFNYLYCEGWRAAALHR